MSTDLQHLLDKIQAEGLDKAKAGADALLDQARAEARRITDAAQQRADDFRAQSERDAEAYHQRAVESIRQAGRDVLLNVEKSAQAMMEALLLKELKAAMALPDVLAQLLREAVAGHARDGDVSARVPKAAEALLPALREKLKGMATRGKVEVVLDAAQGSGFSLRVEDGRVEHDFSAEAVARALAKSLRPQLAELLK